MSERDELRILSDRTLKVAQSEDVRVSIGHPVKFKRVHPDAKLPQKQHDGDACWDLYSVENVSLRPGDVGAIDTGLQMEMPPYIFMSIRPRSGLALKRGLIPVLGTVDSGYRGNVKVLLRNNSQWTQRICVGDRVAQATFELTMTIEFEEVEKLSESRRGEGGFGSTGK